jgi:hypothetical protein
VPPPDRLPGPRDAADLAVLIATNVCLDASPRAPRAAPRSSSTPALPARGRAGDPGLPVRAERGGGARSGLSSLGRDLGHGGAGAAPDRERRDRRERHGAPATRLGVGSRHLRRLFARYLGASPLAVAQTRRVLFVKKLLDGTDLGHECGQRHPLAIAGANATPKLQPFVR